MTARTVALVVLLLVACCSATRILECGSDRWNPDEKWVQITNCVVPPCKLVKTTNAGINMRFTPDHDVKSLTTSVWATILRLPLPFLGVDGTSACEKIYKSDGVTFNGCPLKAGEEYVYKNEFPVYIIYPSIQLKVHWALTDNSNSTVTCFEVPAKIVEPIATKLYLKKKLINIIFKKFEEI